LSFTLLKAKLDRKTEFIGSEDPYVLIKLDKQIVKSTTKEGKSPEWNERFTLSLPENCSNITMEVFNENIETDTLNSSCSWDLSKLVQSVSTHQDIDLTFENKKVGTLSLEYN